jgi:hypothetical protein
MPSHESSSSIGFKFSASGYLLQRSEEGIFSSKQPELKRFLAKLDFTVFLGFRFCRLELKSGDSYDRLNGDVALLDDLLLD